jgi:hypothetical protein
MEFDVTQPVTFDIAVAPPPQIPVSTTTPSNPVGFLVVPGPPGSRGQPGTNVQVVGEVPTGVRDGRNDTFTTDYIFISGSTVVYRNGLREYLGLGYIESGSRVILFSEPPAGDDDIRIDYLVGA